MSKKVKVFKISPDYMSTGVWDEKGRNTMPPKYLDQAALTLLELWHDKWECMFDGSWEESFSPPNKYVMKRWKKQGEVVVNYLNFQAAINGKKHEFVLDIDWEMEQEHVEFSPSVLSADISSIDNSGMFDAVDQGCSSTTQD